MPSRARRTAGENARTSEAVGSRVGGCYCGRLWLRGLRLARARHAQAQGLARPAQVACRGRLILGSSAAARTPRRLGGQRKRNRRLWRAAERCRRLSSASKRRGRSSQAQPLQAKGTLSVLRRQQTCRDARVDTALLALAARHGTAAALSRCALGGSALGRRGRRGGRRRGGRGAAEEALALEDS
eukprot:scaffold82773_cov35-Phaeocystis_antarctica.AAC.2